MTPPEPAAPTIPTSAPAAWVDAAAMSAFDATDAIQVAIGEHEIAVYLVAGELFATDNRCTHGAARLCHGTLFGHEIECPHHQGRFDIRSGEATFAPAKRPLRTYAVRLDGERVLLAIP
ncbi:MAG: non-heme iron oxygenase ferredoxin subunit [Caldimonas sp.]